MVLTTKARAVWLLRITSLWTLWAWGTLVRNMLVNKTNTLAFRLVHIGLAAVSMTLAVGTWEVSRHLNGDSYDVVATDLTGDLENGAKGSS